MEQVWFKGSKEKKIFFPKNTAKDIGDDNQHKK